MSGSSVAAAHVAGIAARFYQQHPLTYSTMDVRNFLTSHAARKFAAPLDSGAPGYSFDGVYEGIAQAP
jgi:hypothetical protein